jgi:hypothetical protein
MDTTGSVAGARRPFLTRADVVPVRGVTATVARWTRDGTLPFVRPREAQRRARRDRIIEPLGAAGGTG